eukprot:scaffold618820_cov38-Prasinocladus_malaysianus.AAC.1
MSMYGTNFGTSTKPGVRAASLISCTTRYEYEYRQFHVCWGMLRQICDEISVAVYNTSFSRFV